jgi:hypothetical protein
MLTWLANLPPEARAHLESMGKDALESWLERVCIMLEDGRMREGSAPWAAYVRECEQRGETVGGRQVAMFGVA